MRDDLKKDLDHLHGVLDDLEELGEIMSEMIATQETVEVSDTTTLFPAHRMLIRISAVQTEALEELAPLHQHLSALQQLHEQYVAYRMAFNKLLLEIARRRQYREAAENIAHGMMRQLESMTEGAYPLPPSLISSVPARVVIDENEFLQRRTACGCTSTRSTGSTSQRTCVCPSRMRRRRGRLYQWRARPLRCCRISTAILLRR